MVSTRSFVHLVRDNPLDPYTHRTVFGPVLLGLVKGDIQEMWTYSDAPEDEAAAKKRDETIEAGSEVAQKARAEAKANAAASNGEEAGDDKGVQSEEGDAQSGNEVVEDDSWMDNKGVATPDNDKVRKRKGRKK